MHVVVFLSRFDAAVLKEKSANRYSKYYQNIFLDLRLCFIEFNCKALPIHDTSSEVHPAVGSFPTQVGVYFCHKLESRKKLHTHKDLNPPYSSFNNAIFHTRRMQNVFIATLPLFLMEVTKADPGRQNKLETRAAAVVRGKRTETRRLYLWHRQCNLQGDFLIPSLHRSGSVEIKGKSIREGV